MLGGRSLRGAALLYAGRLILEHGRKRWDRLTPAEQAELRRLVVQSRGLPSNLTAAEREEISRLVRKAGGRGDDMGAHRP